MVQRVGGDVDHLASGCVDCHRDHVGARAAEFAADVVAGHRDQDERAIDGQFGECFGEDDGEGRRAVAHRGILARGSPHGGDSRQRHGNVAESRFAHEHEVGAEGRHAAANGSSADGPDGDRSTAFREIEEHTGDGGLFRGLPFEPALTGPIGRGFVDAPVSEPAGQTREWVVVGEPRGLVGRIAIHE